jgi:hypothetical protein
LLNPREAEQACVLNYGAAAWAFDSLASQIALKLGVEVASQPRPFNYVLGAEPEDLPDERAQFVDVQTIQLASDKRLLAKAFAAARVPTPVTKLIANLSEARAFVQARDELEWCLKYPIGTGATGHRLFNSKTEVPSGWPTPYVVQEFVRLREPEVYRTYSAAGELFGWLLRRYDGGRGSPWVSHARGARWHRLGEPPATAAEAATRALTATNLLQTFGCVDLLQRSDGSWIVLEVGTDGLFAHVDRDLDDPLFENELLERVCESFTRRFRSLRTVSNR